jgi:hypothetical protein
LAKGLFKPTNPEKYLGDIGKIRFMSSWELRFMNFCDTNPNVIKWGSEEFKIMYFNPIKNKVCNYIPDFIIKYKDRNGMIITEVIEIKPRSHFVASKKSTTYDKVQMIINHAKWTAAKAFCDQHNINFKVLSENELFRH